MEYTITIVERTPYQVTKTAYECADGKRRFSKYDIPEGMDYTEKSYETGETAYTEKEIYSQKQEEIDLIEVVKTVNSI